MPSSRERLSFPRALTTDAKSAADRTLTSVSSEFAESVSESLLIRVRSPELRKQAGDDSVQCAVESRNSLKNDRKAQPAAANCKTFPRRAGNITKLARLLIEASTTGQKAARIGALSSTKSLLYNQGS